MSVGIERSTIPQTNIPWYENSSVPPSSNSPEMTSGMVFFDTASHLKATDAMLHIVNFSRVYQLNHRDIQIAPEQGPDPFEHDPTFGVVDFIPQPVFVSQGDGSVMSGIGYDFAPVGEESISYRGMKIIADPNRILVIGARTAVIDRRLIEDYNKDSQRTHFGTHDNPQVRKESPVQIAIRNCMWEPADKYPFIVARSALQPHVAQLMPTV